MNDIRSPSKEKAIDDFREFTAFWKIPDRLVSQGASHERKDGEDVAPNRFYLQSVNPAGRQPPMFYTWQGIHLFTTLASSKAGASSRDDPVYDLNGKAVGAVTYEEGQNTLTLPFHFDTAIWNLRLEKYVRGEATQPAEDLGRRLYYSIKPAMPRPLRLMMRKTLKEPMAKRSFPAWPVDTSVEQLQFGLLRTLLEARPGTALPVLSFWPGGEDCCLVLTHDVETQQGVNHMDQVIEVERECGVRSSWNFVPKDYYVDPQIFERLRTDGFEIGVHGLYHNGKLFQSREMFLRQVVEINRYIHQWGAAGFRSPSLLRNLDWISESIDIDYDTSCPASEWYGAQPGGCGTVFPFMKNRLVELPITLQQDHTLLEVLDFSPEKMVEHWLATIQKIKQVHGMILLNSHPDYLVDHKRLQAYRNFLTIITQEKNCWRALPREVAKWWRVRQDSSLDYENQQWVIKGPDTSLGKVMTVNLADDHQPYPITFQPLF